MLPSIRLVVPGFVHEAGFAPLISDFWVRGLGKWPVFAIAALETTVLVLPILAVHDLGQPVSTGKVGRGLFTLGFASVALTATSVIGLDLFSVGPPTSMLLIAALATGLCRTRHIALALGAVAVIASPWALIMSSFISPESSIVTIHVAIAGVICGLLAHASRLMFDRSVPIYWVFAYCNVLNVIDAASTHALLGSQHARELNPIIDKIGVTPKIAFVIIASAVLAVLSRRALSIAAAALGAVAVWHVVGWYCSL
jgi:hypothetical protein